MSTSSSSFTTPSEASRYCTRLYGAVATTSPFRAGPSSLACFSLFYMATRAMPHRAARVQPRTCSLRPGQVGLRFCDSFVRQGLLVDSSGRLCSSSRPSLCFSLCVPRQGPSWLELLRFVQSYGLSGPADGRQPALKVSGLTTHTMVAQGFSRISSHRQRWTFFAPKLWKFGVSSLWRFRGSCGSGLVSLSRVFPAVACAVFLTVSLGVSNGSGAVRDSTSCVEG